MSYYQRKKPSRYMEESSSDYDEADLAESDSEDKQHQDVVYVENFDYLSPEIEDICAWRNRGSNKNVKGYLAGEQENEYLVKFMAHSYHHLEWMKESEIAAYSYQAQSKMKRFKLRMKKEFKVPYPGTVIRDILFNKNYLIPERILYTTNMFPVIYPTRPQPKTQDCVDIMMILLNYSRGKIKYGIQLYQIPDTDDVIEQNLQKLSDENTDLGLVINRLHINYYKHPVEFWKELGKVFKNLRKAKKYQENPSFQSVVNTLRELAYHLYVAWHKKKSELVGGGGGGQGFQQLNFQKPNQMTGQQPYQQQLGPPFHQPMPNQNLPPMMVTNQPPANGGYRPPSIDQFQAPMIRPNFPSIPQQQQNQQQELYQRGYPQYQNQYQMYGQPFQNQEEQKTSLSLQNLPTQPNVKNTQPGGLKGGKPPVNQDQKGQQPNQPQTNNQPFMPPLQTQIGQPPNLKRLPSLPDFQNQQSHQFQPQPPTQAVPSLKTLPSIQNLFQNKPNNSGTATPGAQAAKPTLPGMPVASNPNLSKNETSFPVGNLNQQQISQQPASLPQFQQISNQVQPAMQPNMGIGGQPKLPSMPKLPQVPSIQTFQPQNGMGMGQPRPLMFATPQFNQMGQRIQFQGLPFQHQIYGGQQMMMRGHPRMPFGYRGMMMGQQRQMRPFGGYRPPIEKKKPDLEAAGPEQQVISQAMVNDIINVNDHQVENKDLFVEDQDQNDKLEYWDDPGPFNLQWMLDELDGESFKVYQFFTEKEVEQILSRPEGQKYDQCYLVKWRDLSYLDYTWEHLSIIKGYTAPMEDFKYAHRNLELAVRKNYKKQYSILNNIVRNLSIGKNRQKNSKKPGAYKTKYKSQSDYDSGLFHTKLQSLRQALFSQQTVKIQYDAAKNIMPKFRKNQVLKSYQVLGVNWLIRAWHQNRNVVLADEMGLGKTIQTISFLNYLFQETVTKGPFLIVAPLTTLAHWKQIADDWTEMNVILYYDSQSGSGRNNLRSFEWFYYDLMKTGVMTQSSQIYKPNIIITSFEVVVQDMFEVFLQIPIQFIVVDEAHKLKNQQAKTLSVLKEHPCLRILLLTGTPVQNNTQELYTLLNYIEPYKFGNQEAFLERFGDLKDVDQIDKLHKILTPHFLRREKDDVEDSIPPLQETVIEVGLTQLQTAYYKSIYGENKYILQKLINNNQKNINLNNLQTQLRKACNHLFLLKGVQQEICKDVKTDEQFYQKLIDSSGKLILLNKLIDKFKKEGQKVLIFSQFTQMLEILEIYFQYKRIPIETLTGAVKNQDRIMSIQRFNDDKSFGVFLLTTRAGGLGINLTSARVVIIFDSDWNPQNDLQAIARAHRIGQTKEVNVYRLITKKTYEQQMFDRASKKLGMEQALFHKNAFSKGEDVRGNHTKGLELKVQDSDFKPSADDIQTLLKYGAYAFLDEDNGKEDQAQQDINDILKKGRKGQYDKGVYSLQKSTFDVKEYEKNMPKFGDEEFWEKLIPSLENASISTLEKQIRTDRSRISESEKNQNEFYQMLKIHIEEILDQKIKTGDDFSTDDDETRLRDLIMKFIKITGLQDMVKENAKQLLRDLNKPLEDIKEEREELKRQKLKEKKEQEGEGDEVVKEGEGDVEMKPPEAEAEPTPNKDEEVKKCSDIGKDSEPAVKKRRKRKAQKNISMDMDIDMMDYIQEPIQRKRSKRKSKQRYNWKGEDEFSDGDELYKEEIPPPPKPKPVVKKSSFNVPATQQSQNITENFKICTICGKAVDQDKVWECSKGCGKVTHQNCLNDQTQVHRRQEVNNLADMFYNVNSSVDWKRSCWKCLDCEPCKYISILHQLPIEQINEINQQLQQQVQKEAFLASQKQQKQDMDSDSDGGNKICINLNDHMDDDADKAKQNPQLILMPYIKRNQMNGLIDQPDLVLKIEQFFKKCFETCQVQYPHISCLTDEQFLGGIKTTIPTKLMTENTICSICQTDNQMGNHIIQCMIYQIKFHQRCFEQNILATNPQQQAHQQQQQVEQPQPPPQMEYNQQEVDIIDPRQFQQQQLLQQQQRQQQQQQQQQRSSRGRKIIRKHPSDKEREIETKANMKVEQLKKKYDGTTSFVIHSKPVFQVQRVHNPAFKKVRRDQLMRPAPQQPPPNMAYHPHPQFQPRPEHPYMRPPGQGPPPAELSHERGHLDETKKPRKGSNGSMDRPNYPPQFNGPPHFEGRPMHGGFMPHPQMMQYNMGPYPGQGPPGYPNYMPPSYMNPHGPPGSGFPPAPPLNQTTQEMMMKEGRMFPQGEQRFPPPGQHPQAGYRSLSPSMRHPPPRYEQDFQPTSYPPPPRQQQFDYPPPHMNDRTQ